MDKISFAKPVRYSFCIRNRILSYLDCDCKLRKFDLIKFPIFISIYIKYTF